MGIVIDGNVYRCSRKVPWNWTKSCLPGHYSCNITSNWLAVSSILIMAVNLMSGNDSSLLKEMSCLQRLSS